MTNKSLYNVHESWINWYNANERPLENLTTGPGTAPDYNPEDPDFIKSNCYSSACGRKIPIWYDERLEYDFAFDPGYLSGRTPIWNDVYDVTRSVIADFESQGGSAYVISGANGPIPPDYRRIAVRVSSTMTESGKPPYDYHFMYQTSDNRWAEQKGRGGLPNRLEPGQTPDDVEWQYRESFTQKDIPYDSDIVYIAVKNPISW